MNRTYWMALVLIILTGVFSPGLWVPNFPPEWSTDKGPFIAMLRAALTTPFVLAFCAAILTLPVALGKRVHLEADTKTRPMAIAIVLVTPFAFFCLQVMMPFMLNDKVSGESVQLFFLGFMTIFFLTMGNYVAIAPYKGRMGFRTKATLSNKVIWAKTHRFLGRNLVLLTLSVGPAALILVGPQPAQWLLIGAIVMLKLATYIYARQLAARHRLRSGMETELVR